MSYTYLLEREGESWEEYSSDTPQFALWNLNLTAEKSYSKDNETASCPSSQSGMMSPPSTENLGEEKSMSSAEDSLAQISQTEIKKKAGSRDWKETGGGLWFEMLRIIREIRPKFVFVENVPNLVKFGVGTVLGNLAESGYNSRWCVLGSKDCGGVHKRDRAWILAIHPNIDRLQEKQPIDSNVGKKNEAKEVAGNTTRATGLDGIQGYVRPHIAGKDDEMANWLDRFKAVGNGQDAIVAATAWRILVGE